MPTSALRNGATPRCPSSWQRTTIPCRSTPSSGPASRTRTTPSTRFGPNASGLRLSLRKRRRVLMLPGGQTLSRGFVPRYRVSIRWLMGPCYRRKKLLTNSQKRVQIQLFAVLTKLDLTQHCLKLHLQAAPQSLVCEHRIVRVVIHFTDQSFEIFHQHQVMEKARSIYQSRG